MRKYNSKYHDKSVKCYLAIYLSYTCFDQSTLYVGYILISSSKYRENDGYWLTAAAINVPNTCSITEILAI
jgi:hypothetical protein